MSTWKDSTLPDSNAQADSVSCTWVTELRCNTRLWWSVQHSSELCVREGFRLWHDLNLGHAENLLLGWETGSNRPPYAGALKPRWCLVLLCYYKHMQLQLWLGEQKMRAGGGERFWHNCTWSSVFVRRVMQIKREKSTTPMPTKLSSWSCYEQLTSQSKYINCGPR